MSGGGIHKRLIVRRSRQKPVVVLLIGISAVVGYSLCWVHGHKTQSESGRVHDIQPPAAKAPTAVHTTSLQRRLSLIAGISPLLLEGAALAATTTAPAPRQAFSPDNMLTQMAEELGILPLLNSTGQGGLPPIDSGTANILLFLGAFVLLILPILKFLAAGGAAFVVLGEADKRFTSANGRRPTKVLEKVTDRLIGRRPDPLDERRLKVRRLNDEILALRTSVVQQISGVVMGKGLREAAKRDRQLAIWDTVCKDLDLSVEEKKDLGKALLRYARRELTRRDDVVEIRKSWVKGALTRPFFLNLLDQWRYGREVQRELDLQGALFKAVQKAVSDDKAEKILDALSRCDDPLDLASSSSATDSREKSKHVYVLSFDGDIGASNVQQLQQEVTAILAMDSVPSEVVLLLRSPGGTVTGYGLAAAQLMRLRHHGVQLTACVDEVAASGGYLMACCADKILCSPFAAIGSIGVISGVPNVAERLDREGIRFIETTAGKWKRTVTPTREPTDEDLAKAKADIQMVYEQFAGFVKTNRPDVDLDVVATGEVWFGQNALARGLVDGLQTSAEYLLQATTSGQYDVFALSYAGAPSGGAQGPAEGSLGTANIINKLAESLLQPPVSAGMPSWQADLLQPRFQADFQQRSAS